MTKHIVDPLDLGVHSGALLNGQGHRGGGAGGQREGIPGGEIGAEKKAQVKAGIWGGEETVIPPAPTGGLGNSHQSQSLMGPLLRSLA